MAQVKFNKFVHFVQYCKHGTKVINGVWCSHLKTHCNQKECPAMHQKHKQLTLFRRSHAKHR